MSKLAKFSLIAIAVWVLSGNQLSYIVNYIGAAYCFQRRATFHVRFLSVSFKSRLIESREKFSIFKTNFTHCIWTITEFILIFIEKKKTLILLCKPILVKVATE